MAGDWIEWSKGLANRREVVVLAGKLGRDRFEIAGRLMSLWEWADDNIPDKDIDDETGDASLFLGDKPFDFLDALLGLPGFADAMASPEVCWLTARSGGRLTFPKFGRHNGTTAKTRALGRRKKQEQRSTVPKMSPKKRDNCPDFQGTKSGPQNRTEEISNKGAPQTPGFPGFGVDGSWPLSGDARDFLEAWNLTAGVQKADRYLSMILQRALMERLDESPPWKWREALACFPLKFFESKGGMGLPKFLKPETVPNILAKSYDWSREPTAGKGRPGMFDGLQDFANDQT